MAAIPVGPVRVTVMDEEGKQTDLGEVGSLRFEYPSQQAGPDFIWNGPLTADGRPAPLEHMTVQGDFLGNPIPGAPLFPPGTIGSFLPLWAKPKAPPIEIIVRILASYIQDETLRSLLAAAMEQWSANPGWGILADYVEESGKEDLAKFVRENAP